MNIAAFTRGGNAIKGLPRECPGPVTGTAYNLDSDTPPFRRLRSAR